ncbi:MAG: homoserine dehydrogenase, partial [Anaerohalosphaera sp.]|nr:homoserine dehydrogenase [Anaerohalosphaera sp.]
EDILEDEDISIGIELIGGVGVARTVVEKLLRAGKDVVTANKALLAHHGEELFNVAHANGKCIAFEASCAGGIPIVSAIRTGLAANRIDAIYGILNGTCNYILTDMTNKNEDFETALAKAQAKGYAETDPTLDINGADTAHKLAILGEMAFGCQISFDDIYFEGIENVTSLDIRYGLDMGYTLKLLAIGERKDNGRISLRVHPSFIPTDSPLARVGGAFNAVSIMGHAVGQTMYYGRGAGMMPTASAVVADIIEVAMGNSKRIFDGQKIEQHDKAVTRLDSIDNLISRFYIRLMVKEQPGVVATYARILGDHQISISGALQREEPGITNVVPVIITTNRTCQKNMSAALAEIESLDIVTDKATCIRIVGIPEDKIED